MIVSAKKIIELNKNYNLIENLAERELNPEGVGIDIRVGEIYKIKGKAFLGIEKRITPKIQKIADIKQGYKKVIINPSEFVLVRTIEKINVPSKKIEIEKGKRALLMVDVYPRSTLQRCGIYFIGTKTDPGYSGELVFGLANIGNCSFELELGARIANLVFKIVLGDIARAYNGQWKGGRVSTEGEEEVQI